MEGLLLAEALEPLSALLPLAHTQWRFPDARTAVLPLDDGSSLWISSRPPHPRLEVRAGVPEPARARTTFQELLAARAEGPLVRLAQHSLDRVAELGFGATQGFVPAAPVTLVAELTGRNANLVLLDEERRILGVERVILHERNRFRELKPGVAYVPPPPYDKLDPRSLDAEALAAALAGHTLAQVKRVVDGVGPELTAALAVAAGVAPGDRLEGDALRAVVAALGRLARAPSRVLAETGGGRSVADVRRAERVGAALAEVRAGRRADLELAEKRVRDAELATEAGADAERLRGEADLLMAYAASVPDGAEEVRLTGFDGAETVLELDPVQDARANARKRYERARKREARAQRAAGQRPELERARDEAAAALEAVERLSEPELVRAAEGLRRARARRGAPRVPGVRFRDPRGFEVVVGRNARENDVVTFRLARSRDLWLHVQGYTGSHVIVRAENREVPFDTVLFAARLAAGFSAARQSDNVPVDVTQRKHVWKVKGQGAGAVNYTQQKTLYVTPARRDAEAAGSGDDAVTAHRP